MDHCIFTFIELNLTFKWTVITCDSGSNKIREPKTDLFGTAIKFGPILIRDLNKSVPGSLISFGPESQSEFFHKIHLNLYSK